MQLLETTFWSAGGSRHGMAEQLGFSKSKTNALIAGLVEQGLLAEAGLQRSSGGRRPENLQLHAGLGVVVGIDIGATSVDVAVLGPDLAVLAHHGEPADVREGPGVVLARVRVLVRELLSRAGFAPRQVIGIGIGVPGPVNFEIGQLVNPPLMPAWDSFSIRDYLREEYAAPVFVDNDVNLMALGELWRLRRSLTNFLVIKVGTGIGCGIVCHGEVYRGAAGSAGDVGHICVDQEGPRCHCGNLGCVEVMAAGPAITRMAVEAAMAGESAALAECLRAQGRIDAIDVGEASRAGDASANAIVQRAGSLIGQMLASIVNFFNPSHVFIGGGITRIGPLFLAAVRQSVYQRSLALSTRHLEIQYTPLGAQAGLIGAGALAMHETLKVRGVAP
ncbi:MULTISPECIES: ROK family protein [Variovorax]|uniref:ROK family protein n=1 Tax=Variovorax ginsengisoli TaxID=363844 RepID=A0ABT8S085_9BURK|nr:MULTISPECIES: ROK family protein [Variovorax]MDM0082671.1 ROK family protein [Variovorax sp. J31P179]MDN8613080.1 ROK family protein [Variovorax ginsengisoli]MDO1532250.1 ROK family protein [Variovorax ginsengisoli]HET7836535.1 ROK family protein [Variovorax sp.]